MHPRFLCNDGYVDFYFIFYFKVVFQIIDSVKNAGEYDGLKNKKIMWLSRLYPAKDIDR